jgi:hypothetical protein
MYRSTSQDEVLERRVFKDAAKRMAAMSHYITKPQDPSEIRTDEVLEFANVRPFILPKCQPYQQKTVYKVN